MTIIVGIDPGVVGGMAAFEGDALLGARVVNTGSIREIQDAWEALIGGALSITEAIVERNHPVPGMGAVSAFTFGKNYGTLLAIMDQEADVVRVVTAQSWRSRALKGRVPKDRRARDAATVEAAMERWRVFTWPERRKHREALACAMFIGTYGRDAAVLLDGG